MSTTLVVRLLMIIVGHTWGGILREGVIECPLVLESMRRIKQHLVLVVTLVHHTKDTRGVVIVRQHLVHGLIHEVSHEVQPELHHLLFVSSQTLLALLIGHAQRLEALGQGHGIFTFREARASQERRAGF